MSSILALLVLSVLLLDIWLWDRYCLPDLQETSFPRHRYIWPGGGVVYSLLRR